MLVRNEFTSFFIQKGNILAKLKTTENEGDVAAYLNEVEDEQKRKDCLAIMELMKQETKKEPKMWGGSIVGFGNYHYKYPTGREGDWFLTGFAPRKKNITLYIMAGFDDYGALLEKLGKYKTGKSCLYVNKLEDVHLPTLKKLVRQSATYVAGLYP